MTTRRSLTLCVTLLAAALAPRAAPPLAAQVAPAAPPADSAAGRPATDSAKVKKPKAPRAPVRIFDSVAPLSVTITADIDRLRRDRRDGAPWRAATLAYADSVGDTTVVPLRVRTRGIWRLAHCAFPPLRLDFARESARPTAFAGLNRPKLVNVCQDSDRGEQYVLQEYQLYRVYNLLTPLSHRARLLRITYADSGSGRPRLTRYAILVEEPEAMAERAGGALLEQQGATAEDLDPYGRALHGVFQYLIGNTDWSAAALHNVELVGTPAGIQPVAYDFDYAGAIDTYYAAPNERLPIRDVRQRLYRGHCAPAEAYARVFALFQARRDSIVALYHDPVGRLLEPRTVERTLRYFDDFYRTIGDAGDARHAILDACRNGG
ncbi:MAG TPA: hypothetical protein VF048_08620 [Gemmatimonadaceae bacterium]